MLALRDLPGDRLELSGLDATVVHCLRRIPAILARRDSAGLRNRLHPDALPHEPARNAEWHRLMDSELRRLFEKAEQTLARDLDGVTANAVTIAFPTLHLKAWMSAINQARVLLAEEHQLEARDMERDQFMAGSDRDRALVEVQILGYLLHVLVEHALEGA